jgi:hypothetical protein
MRDLGLGRQLDPLWAARSENGELLTNGKHGSCGVQYGADFDAVCAGGYYMRCPRSRAATSAEAVAVAAAAAAAAAVPPPARRTRPTAGQARYRARYCRSPPALLPHRAARARPFPRMPLPQRLKPRRARAVAARRVAVPSTHVSVLIRTPSVKRTVGPTLRRRGVYAVTDAAL